MLGPLPKPCWVDYAVVTPSRDRAVYGEMWCMFARRLGIPAPRIRWYSGPDWTPFGTVESQVVV